MRGKVEEYCNLAVKFGQMSKNNENAKILMELAKWDGEKVFEEMRRRSGEFEELFLRKAKMPKKKPDIEKLLGEYVGMVEKILHSYFT